MSCEKPDHVSSCINRKTPSQAGLTKKKMSSAIKEIYGIDSPDAEKIYDSLAYAGNYQALIELKEIIGK